MTKCRRLESRREAECANQADALKYAQVTRQGRL